MSRQRSMEQGGYASDQRPEIKDQKPQTKSGVREQPAFIMVRSLKGPAAVPIQAVADSDGSPASDVRRFSSATASAARSAHRSITSSRRQMSAGNAPLG